MSNAVVIGQKNQHAREYNDPAMDPLTDARDSLSRQQVRAVDRIATQQFHVPGIVLMENAAIYAAEVAWQMLGENPATVTLVCGGGNNGGDGLAIARHLHNRGCECRIVLSGDPAGYHGDALINWQIVNAMGIGPKSYASADPIGLPSALIIDAIFGTGLSQSPRAGHVLCIDAINNAGRPILAIDLPSGLDCDTGLPLGSCVRATRTVTFVASKRGFLNPQSLQYTGIVDVADIGCPRDAIKLARTSAA